jgi:hypothetical protein
MNRIAIIALAFAGLAGAGVAIAATLGATAVDPVSGTLAVGSSAQTSLQSCTSQAGTFTVVKLDVNATASSSEPSLKGAARLVLKGSIDTESDAGTFSGTLRIDVASGPDTLASFSGVYANGELHGLLTGRSPSSGRANIAQPFDRLVANMSANLNPSSGQLSSLKIGQTDSGGPAVFVGSACKPPASTAGGAPSRPNP